MIDYRVKFAAVITSACHVAEMDAIAAKLGDPIAYGRLCARKCAVDAYIEDWQEEIGQATRTGAVDDGEDGIEFADITAYMAAATTYNGFIQRLKGILGGTPLAEPLHLDKADG